MKNAYSKIKKRKKRLENCNKNSNDDDDYVTKLKD